MCVIQWYNKSTTKESFLAWQSSVSSASPGAFCGEQHLHRTNVRGVIVTINGIVGSSRGVLRAAIRVAMPRTGGKRQRKILNEQSRWRITRCVLAWNGAALSRKRDTGIVVLLTATVPCSLICEN